MLNPIYTLYWKKINLTYIVHLLPYSMYGNSFALSWSLDVTGLSQSYYACFVDNWDSIIPIFDGKMSQHVVT